MIHRWLLDALGDPELLELAAGARAIEPAAWGRAVERVRRRRYPSLPESEGNRRVGVELGEAFLAGPIGASVREVIGVLPLDRMMEVVLGIGERLRSDFDMNFEGDRSGGVLCFNGPRVTPCEATLGFVQALVACLSTPCEVSLGASDETTLRIKVRAAAEPVDRAPE